VFNELSDMWPSGHLELWTLKAVTAPIFLALQRLTASGKWLQFGYREGNQP
jgi:hypothetical protein